MKLKPLITLDPRGVNRTSDVLDLLVKNSKADPSQQVRQYLIERLGYTEARADALLRNDS